MEDDDDEGEDGGEDDSEEDSGLSPFPFKGLSSSPFPLGEPSPFEGLELSPNNLEFLSSYRTFTMWVMLKKDFLKAFSYYDILLSPPLDMLTEASRTN